MSSHRSGGDSHGRRHRRQSSARDAPRPPSPAEILQEAQNMMRQLQSHSEGYTDQYNYHVREAKRLQIMLKSATDERALLSNSAAAAQAARQGRMVDYAEMEAKRRQLEKEIDCLQSSIRHYENASAAMQRLWRAVGDEIQWLQREIEYLRSPLASSRDSRRG